MQISVCNKSYCLNDFCVIFFYRKDCEYDHMFEEFVEEQVTLSNGISIRVRHKGTGSPVLLLHGYPQTSACWHAVAPHLLNAGYCVVIPDLRGYGGSDKPDSTADHSPYSKREMAMDQVLLMQQLGHEQFYLVGHDRGGRVAHRLALDHPEQVLKIAVLDIAPTISMYQQTDKLFATAYYHWFFLIQPTPLPETLIAANPDFYLRSKLAAWGRSGMSAYNDSAIEEYINYFADWSAIHASCEDYRAAATIDLQHDTADEEKRIQCPLLALWGEKGLLEQLYDVLAFWREKADMVEGRGLPCGHFLPEEEPERTSLALIEFFSYPH